MPKRTDINSILVIGAGPIVIGQACEFDYSGTQACKALKEEGYKVILVNSNPATIMTDPEMASVTYIEPITPEFLEQIIIKEKPDVLLPTVGGQTSLNCAMQLVKNNVLQEHNVELIGASHTAIEKAENRKLFSKVLDKIGLHYPKNLIISNIQQAHNALEIIGLPMIIRPSFTLGGAGGGVAYNKEEFLKMVAYGLEVSPIKEVQVDQFLLGWKEFEMEVIRDRNDNCIVVCSIENIDPMGVHTGDSITVAPALTLRDSEYQKMRDASFAILREIGVDTGGANVQFAINPDEDESLAVIEMNPRVSRSSALASKATGFPIAKVAAKLAVGYTLDEIQNDCVQSIPAAFEPAIDYIVTKIPRFNFDKFHTIKPELSSTMKSVGEVMGIGRCFAESLQKALCSLETGLTGLNPITPHNSSIDEIMLELAKIQPNRILVIADAMRIGLSINTINKITKYNKWFLEQIMNIIIAEKEISTNEISSINLLEAKKLGFSDARLKELTGQNISSIRKGKGIIPVYKRIDTCAAEFNSNTTYMYSCYESGFECEANVSNKKKVIVLGSGPNRIGQGIEFDYACVHAVKAIQGMEYEAILINCNPETVSTDYDISDRLYFSPITEEHVLDIIEKEQQHGVLVGVIVQFGGQTPLKLAKSLEKHNIPILGISCDSIDKAEDRNQFKELLQTLKIQQPRNTICHNKEELIGKVSLIGLPIVMRPSYVLGGQSMAIIHTQEELKRYLQQHKNIFFNGPLLLDSFLIDAIELDVDLISDGTEVYIAGIMEHIEEAGIHSGDSSCVLPTYKINKHIVCEIERQAKSIALALKVKGLVNIQFAIRKNKIYILEVNPRASRTIPFISKATNRKIAQIATKVMLGKTLSDFTLDKVNMRHIAVKTSVFPFSRFPGVDIILGPEMKSTGEVMGLDNSFGAAFAKAYIATGNLLPLTGTVFISVQDNDKSKSCNIAEDLSKLGFNIIATGGTAKFFNKNNIIAKSINKVREGRPHIVDMLISDKISLVINTSEGIQSITDSTSIRTTTLNKKIPYCTTITAAEALVFAIKHIKSNGLSIKALQDY